MTKLSWDSSERQFYQGLSRGVLYPGGTNGVAWNGLVSVNESDGGILNEPEYMDGNRLPFTQNLADFSCKLSAYTYPDEFEPYIGVEGILTGQDASSEFGLSYQTMDNDSPLIHLVYNAQVVPASVSRNTVSDNPSPTLFEWDISTRPIQYSNVAPTAHIIIELESTSPYVLESLNRALYGSDNSPPRLPEFTELYGMYADNSVIFVDNGDGTWTATGPDEMVKALSIDSYSIDSPSVVQIEAQKYQIKVR